MHASTARLAHPSTSHIVSNMLNNNITGTCIKAAAQTSSSSPSSSSCSSSSSLQFTLSTWNILASCYCHPANYWYCQKESLQWKYRLGLILKELNLPSPSAITDSSSSASASDSTLDSTCYTANEFQEGTAASFSCLSSSSPSSIHCLSEVDDPTSLIASFQAAGYDHVFFKRGEEFGTNLKQDGLLTAWKRSEWVLAEEATKLNLNVLADVATAADRSRFLRHNIALMVRLKSRVSRSTSSSASSHDAAPEILIVNTHLYWQAKASDVRMKQTQLIVSYLAESEKRRSALNKPNTPIIFAGDFNASPLSNVYQYLTNNAPAFEHEVFEAAEAEDAMPDSSSAVSSAAYNPRLLVDKGLNRLARWLRVMGVDVEEHNWKADHLVNDRETIDALFHRAKRERRILLSTNSSLLQRRNCPPSFLINCNAGYEKMFYSVIKHFNLKYDEKHIYSRCSLCNGNFEKIENIQTIGLEAPRDLPLRIYEEQTDEEGKKLDFFRCLRCLQVYWLGHKSSVTLSRFKQLFDRYNQQMNQEIKDCSKENESEVTLSREINAEEKPESFLHSLARKVMRESRERQSPIQFCSAYARANANTKMNREIQSTVVSSLPDSMHHLEPSFTNFTSTFRSTIDYIFFTSRSSCNTSSEANWPQLNVVSNKALPSLEEVERQIALPSSSYPSDHLHLQATFQLITPTMSQ